jgi:hypothetical protein
MPSCMQKSSCVGPQFWHRNLGGHAVNNAEAKFKAKYCGSS